MSTADGVKSARAAGLHYSKDTTRGFARRAHGRGFVYVTARGRLVRDRATLRRIQALVLPPAWRHVHIAADPRAHVQATGVDAKGRKQYRYHPSWTAVRDATKFHRMLAFAKALPVIRRRAARDLRGTRLSRPYVLATVVQLLERTHIRIGNEEYARTNHSHGLTTMRDRHVKIRAKRVHFDFRAKSGVHQTVDLEDARLARAVRACQDLPGQTLFQYLDEAGTIGTISSADVNAYLQEIAGDEFTAKDFRTWAGSVGAAQALDEIGVTKSTTAGSRAIVKAVDRVAKQLGNTRSVCRKCYIHPAVLDAYRTGITIGRLFAAGARNRRGLLQAEAALVSLLRTSHVRSGGL